MPIEINEKTYRNLEEQVLYLTKQLEYLKQSSFLLGQMGIKVVGEVEDEEDLPDPEVYPGNYGDAYITSSDSHYHIFTRPFPGDTYPHWFDLGIFPAPGPEGPEGPEGPAGDPGPRGATWGTGSNNPAITEDTVAGDLYLKSNGKVYRFDGSAWNIFTDLIGAQGPQGIQGPQGPQGIQGVQGLQGPQGRPGESFDIQGVLTSIDDLPEPSEDILNDAYLIPDAGGNNHIWFIAASTMLWTDGGPFGTAGTVVKVSGSPVDVFNADTKLNKGPDGVADFVYVRNSAGVDTYTTYGQTKTSKIMWRDANNRSRIGDPVDADHIMSKGYADSHYGRKGQQLTEVMIDIPGLVGRLHINQPIMKVTKNSSQIYFSDYPFQRSTSELTLDQVINAILTFGDESRVYKRLMPGVYEPSGGNDMFSCSIKFSLGQIDYSYYDPYEGMVKNGTILANTPGVTVYVSASQAEVTQ